MKILIITIILLTLNSAFAQHHNDHSNHLKEKSKPTHSNVKFKSNADLKKQMEKILSLMKELEEKKNDSKEVSKYGGLISESVNNIFKTCKLEPDADDAIHPSLGLILEGATDFKNGDYKSGHSKIHDGLIGYEKNFIHDGWKH
jgi:hypothetical protein